MYRQYLKQSGGSSSSKTSKQSDSSSKTSKQSDSVSKTSKQTNESTLQCTPAVVYKPAVKEYEYGKERKRPPFWERDRATHRRLWKAVMKEVEDQNSPPSSRENSPEPPPKPKPKPEKLLKVLHVKDLNLHIAENAKKNKTSTYDCTEDDREDDAGNNIPAELVARRGNFVKMTISLDRPYNKEKDDLRLCFYIGKNPRQAKGTFAQMKIDEDGKTEYKFDEWGGYLENKSGNDLCVMVHIPANCIIGEWTLTVKTFTKVMNKAGKEKMKIYQWKYDADVTIVFNPWCKDDDVYMEDQKLLNEYILNESGCVYQGNAWTRGAKPWNFGQFEDGIADICLYLVRTGFKGKITRAMADPVKVSRVLAKMVNSCDDRGVLEGNWSGNYKDGKSPTAWVGSPKILKQFMESGPVKYGQCWVFSCLLTTVCRAVGIPCRSVTNFASAHDSNETNSIEKVWKRENGVLMKLPEFEGDSVWNFHVWNEVYFVRQDLQERDYDGWQVIDATPQEKSEGIFTCGPCPVKAVQRGDCTVNYDTGFVFSEVNADYFELEKLPDGSFKVLKQQTAKIGKNISTKIPDGKPFKDKTFRDCVDRKKYDEQKRLDITLEYKFPEGSEQEREAVHLAHKTAKSPLAGLYDKTADSAVQEVEFHLKHSNEIMIGQPLPIELTAKNVGTRERNIFAMMLVISPKSYTGQTGNAFCRKHVYSKKLPPGEEFNFNVELTPDDYIEHLVEQANLEIEASMWVSPVEFIEGSEQDSVKTHDFRFRRPDLDVEGPDEAKKKTPVQFTVSFKNPLPVQLTGCKISMESSGFKNTEDQDQPDVPINGEYKETFTMSAKKNDLHDISFSFDCNELKDITGADFINII